MEDQIIPNADDLSIMILDCIACPRSSLAEDAQGTKAICSALTDILWFSDYVFPGQPGSPDPVKITVIAVNPGKESCSEACCFSVEIRFDTSYSREEILAAIRKHTYCKFTIRKDIPETAVLVSW